MLLLPSSEGSYPFDTGMVHKVIPTVSVVSVREGAWWGIAVTAVGLCFYMGPYVVYYTLNCDIP